MAVDGGLDHALAAGLEPTHLVGDLDSVTEAALAWAARHTDISRHPREQGPDRHRTRPDVSAAKFDPERITLVGGGDRLDHTIAGIGALGALSLTSVPVLDGWWDGQHFRVVHGPGSATLRLVPGSTLSLLALHGPCLRVTLSGARGSSTSSTSNRWWAWASATRSPTPGDPVEVDPHAVRRGPHRLRRSGARGRRAVRRHHADERSAPGHDRHARRVAGGRRAGAMTRSPRPRPRRPRRAGRDRSRQPRPTLARTRRSPSSPTTRSPRATPRSTTHSPSSPPTPASASRSWSPATPARCCRRHRSPPATPRAT
jgi:hypothetical protein